VLRTLAVAAIVIVTGAGPQLNVMTPPAATAATTAAEVQLAALPSPTTRFGCPTSTACPSAGTAAFPAGFPAEKATFGGIDESPTEGEAPAPAGTGDPAGDPATTGPPDGLASAEADAAG